MYIMSHTAIITQTNEFLNSIQNHMLSPKNMMNIANNQKPNFYKPRVVEKKKANISNLVRQKMFIPGKKDTLFWIFYILKNGFDKYNLIGSNEYVYEKKHLKNEAMHLLFYDILDTFAWYIMNYN